MPQDDVEHRAPGNAKPIVFSGIQPTGHIHLGNYLGAIRPWVSKLAHRDNIFCVVDLHAVTLFQEPDRLRAASRATVALLVACGLDPRECLLYIQSNVSAHVELGWLLTCITPVSWLMQMPQYNEKTKREKSPGAGLLTYPVLQTADILLFGTDIVPTGDDQRPHIDLARDIAGRFNALYGPVFKLPRGETPEVGARIMGLDNPTVKMSKSLMQYSGHGIGLLDSTDQVVASCKRAVTDSSGVIAFSDDPTKAGVNNLLRIYQACTNKTEAEVLADFSTARGYGDLKLGVADVVTATLRPIQQRYNELVRDVGALESVIARGAQEAIARSASWLSAAKRQMGF